MYQLDLFPHYVFILHCSIPYSSHTFISLIDSDVLNKWLINFSNGNLITLILFHISYNFITYEVIYYIYAMLITQIYILCSIENA